MDDKNIKEYMIDFLSITVHASVQECVDEYNLIFSHALGELADQDHGAKGFSGLMTAAQGFQLKHNQGHEYRNYCSFVFPGNACKAVPPEFFIAFYRRLMRKEIRNKVTRIDLAFDEVPFTPRQFKEILEEDDSFPEKGLVRSLTQRDSLHWHEESLKVREDESGKGRDTCYFGSRQSERYLRVYNMRGPTRFEVEFKGIRAEFIAHDLLSNDEEKWIEIAMGHILDFIDINTSWWKEFKADHSRVYTKLHSAEEKELNKTIGWLMDQVAPTLAAVHKCTGPQIFSTLLDDGEKRIDKKLINMISLHELNSSDYYKID